MLLDSFTAHSLTFQITYAECYEVWDHAGAVARKFASIWPELQIDRGVPNEQVMRGLGVTLQTGLTSSLVTLDKAKLDQGTMSQLSQTYEVWRTELRLEELTRVSCRVRYIKNFSEARSANNFVVQLGLVPWPAEKVFDQPTDGELNGVEIAYRFEDEASFAVLRVGAEHIKLERKPHPEFESETIKQEKHRAFIDFDRGLLAGMEARTLRVDEWLKGYQHLLRRDLEKVIRRRS